MPLSSLALKICLETSPLLKHHLLFLSEDEYESSKSASDREITPQPVQKCVMKPVLKRTKCLDKPKSDKDRSRLAKKRKLNPERVAKYKERHLNGEFFLLYEKYRNEPENFYEYTRMSVKTFDYLLQHVNAHRESIKAVTSPEKLFMTLRYLSQRLTMTNLSEAYYLGRSTVSKCIYTVINDLWNALSPIHMPKPTQEALTKIAEEYYAKYQFPNCIGYINEKKFRVKLKEGGCGFKKKSFLTMQAIVDANYKFIAVEVYYKTDENSFRSSNINELLETRKFNVPPPKEPPNSDVKLPFVLVGGRMYPLTTYLMRPYTNRLDNEKEIFNARLAKTKPPMEGAFNILIHKWNSFTKPLEINLKNAGLLFNIACLLHNVVRDIDGDSDKHFIEFKENIPVEKTRGFKQYNRSTKQAVTVRDLFKDYFIKNPI